MNIIVAYGAAGLAGFAASGFLHLLAGLISFAYVQEAGVATKARCLYVTRRLLAGAALVAEASGSTKVEWSTGRENVSARAC